MQGALALILHKSGSVHACNPNTQQVRQEDREIKVILSYILSLKAVWNTRDPTKDKVYE